MTFQSRRLLKFILACLGFGGLPERESRRICQQDAQDCRNSQPPIQSCQDSVAPVGYGEETIEASTPLAEFFSILLLGLEKVEMIRRPRSMTDCEAVAKGFGEISLGRLYGIVHGFASCEMGGDG